MHMHLALCKLGYSQFKLSFLEFYKKNWKKEREKHKGKSGEDLKKEIIHLSKYNNQPMQNQKWQMSGSDPDVPIRGLGQI